MNAGDFASRSNAKANHKDEILPAHSQELYLLEKELGPMLPPREYSTSDHEVSKKLIRLLRHGHLPREDDGAIEFWRIKACIVIIGLTTSGRKPMAGGGGNKKRYQYCTDSSGTILYLRALQGHSGRSLIDPTLQDNVVIPDGFLKYIYHVGCAINLHSIINLGFILGG